MNEIGHVTKARTNLFEDLGFTPAEAEAHRLDAEREIHQLLALKVQLMGEIADWIKAEHLKQEDAARILQVTRPRISDVVNRKGAKFTLDALVNMLARLGKPVRIEIG